MSEFEVDPEEFPDDWEAIFRPPIEGHLTEHPPERDIDDYVPKSNFRIERMGEDALWLCAYTEDPDAPDINYDISVTDEGGIRVTRRAEPTPQLKTDIDVYIEYYNDEITREEAIEAVGEENWDEVSRLAAYRLSREGDQPITEEELREKYNSE